MSELDQKTKIGWDIIDVVIKITMPFVVASLVAVTGILWSMNRDLAVLQNKVDVLHNRANPPEWLLTDISEIKEDIKDIKKSLNTP